MIEGRLRLPDNSPVNMTRITLNNGEHSTYSRLDGSFSFFHVYPGVHLLDVHSHAHLFSQVKIQILPDESSSSNNNNNNNAADSAAADGSNTGTSGMDNLKCIEYVYPGATKQPILSCRPLILQAHAQYVYFEPRKGFSAKSILKNPMMLMMLFSGVLMFFMPKIMEGMEPEEKERMRKQMANQQDPAKMLSSMFADLTGAAEEVPEKSPKKKIRGKRE